MPYDLSNQQLRQKAQLTLTSRSDRVLEGCPDLLHSLRLVDCDGPTGSLVLAYDTLPWMANILGVVHGGITATLLDNAMGVTACTMAGRATPTITMTVNYAKPVPLNATVHVRTRTVSLGRTTIHLCAELFLPNQPMDSLVSATGVYYAALTQSKL